MITMVEIRKTLWSKAALERKRMQDQVNPIRPCLYCTSVTASRDFLCSGSCRIEWDAENSVPQPTQRGGRFE